MLLRLRIELPQFESGLCPGGAPLGIHADGLHGRQIDHEAILQDSLSDYIVYSDAEGDRKVRRSRKAHCLSDLTGVVTSGNERRLAVNHPVVDFSRLLEVGMCRCQRATGEAFFESVDYRRSDHGDLTDVRF